MTEATRRTRGLQRGPRAAQVVESVRAATLAEVARAGFAALTMDAVAKAAGVSRTTIYRRWPTKTALLAAMLEPLLESYDHDPDTGSLHDDLLALSILIRDNTARPEGRVMFQAAQAGAAELHDLLENVKARAVAPYHRVLRRAVARGELAPGADPYMIAYLLFSGVIMWEQMNPAPPTDDDCARLVRTVLH